MSGKRLTEKQHWDNYWSKFQLPVEIKNSTENLLLNEELNIFDKYLPHKPLSVLEIGGAPGQYLAYMHKNFGYQVHCLDYSEIGCEKTKENFKLLNIPVKVYHEDVFSENLGIPQFDIVFSMGLIEHFDDVSQVVQKHLDLLKPGGILMLGLPNLRGINHLFLRFLAPELLRQHNLQTMNIKTWKSFEKEFGLEIIFKNYIGGFEPMTLLVQEKKSFFNNCIFFKARVLNRIFHKNFKFFRKLNSRFFSAYILAVYRKPE